MNILESALSFIRDRKLWTNEEGSGELQQKNLGEDLFWIYGGDIKLFGSLRTLIGAFDGQYCSNKI